MALSQEHNTISNDPVNTSLHGLHSPGYIVADAIALASVVTQQQGDVCYQIDIKQYFFWNGASWVNFSTIQLGSVVSITSDFSCTGAESGILANCTGGIIVVTLPPVPQAAQSIYFVKTDNSVNLLKIIGFGSTTINGFAGAYAKTGVYQGSLVLTYDGTSNWNVTSFISDSIPSFGEPIATGLISHSEGFGSVASGDYSHAEGQLTVASADSSHSEGRNTQATSPNSHAEGNLAVASGNTAHAEGSSTTASNNNAHAEGNTTIASGQESHAEGILTQAINFQSHAEGSQTLASGGSAHAEGTATIASGDYSHAEGLNTTASDIAAHAEGYLSTASVVYAHAEGRNSNAAGVAAHAEGRDTNALTQYAHAEGHGTVAQGDSAHAEGQDGVATGLASHTEGFDGAADGNYSHVEGQSSSAVGVAAHAEGNSAANADYSHSEGNTTTADGTAAHAEGSGTIASGDFSHAEGSANTAAGVASHAGGTGSEANNLNSFAHGAGAIVNHDNSAVLCDSAGITSLITDQLVLSFANGVVVNSGAVNLTTSGGGVNIGAVTSDSFVSPTEFQIASTTTDLVLKSIVSNGQKLYVKLPVVYLVFDIGDLPAGGSIGVASLTVDLCSSFTIPQTTAGQTITIPNPTDTTAGRFVTVMNNGSTSFTMFSVVIAAGAGLQIQWSGSSWILLGHG